MRDGRSARPFSLRPCALLQIESKLQQAKPRIAVLPEVILQHGVTEADGLASHDSPHIEAGVDRGERGGDIVERGLAFRPRQDRVIRRADERAGEVVGARGYGRRAAGGAQRAPRSDTAPRKCLPSKPCPSGPPCRKEAETPRPVARRRSRRRRRPDRRRSRRKPRRAPGSDRFCW